MGQRLDARLELHERAELRDARDAARQPLAYFVHLGHSRPRVGSELLQPERYLPLFLVHAQHLDRDLLARFDDLRRVRHAGPRHLGHVEQPLNTCAEIDERAELADGGDTAGHDGAGDDLVTDLGGVRPLLVLEERATGDDDVRAAFLVLDDPELVDMPCVRRRISAAEIDLGNRTEGATPADAHLVAAFYLPLDLAFHRQAALKGVFQLPIARRCSRQLSRDLQPPCRRYHHHLNAVAQRHFELAFGVLQFGEIHYRFTLAANVD